LLLAKNVSLTERPIILRFVDLAFRQLCCVKFSFKLVNFPRVMRQNGGVFSEHTVYATEYQPF